MTFYVVMLIIGIVLLLLCTNRPPAIRVPHTDRGWFWMFLFGCIFTAIGAVGTAMAVVNMNEGPLVVHWSFDGKGHTFTFGEDKK